MLQHLVNIWVIDALVVATAIETAVTEVNRIGIPTETETIDAMITIATTVMTGIVMQSDTIVMLRGIVTRTVVIVDAANGVVAPHRLDPDEVIVQEGLGRAAVVIVVARPVGAALLVPQP